ncbi:FAD-binding PCMH-type domain-containing protein [Aphelenchoides bicaudatus]|nr:FAD-binding PCMH-type domain-containing protein [Aphelenchoides bicaudatus]
MGTNTVDALKKRVIRWLEDNRGLVIVIFCLPASFIFDTFISLRCWFQRTFLSAPKDHLKRVRTIQEAVRKWNLLPEKERRPLCTAKPNWLSLSTTFFKKDQCHQIPIPLYDILELDEDNLKIKVEPNVTVRDLTKFLNPKGYTLAIGDATAGGLAFGVGMTTYSHKVGLYQETILSYDVVTAEGELIHVTADNEHSDLFYCLPWSHGTLCFLVALELQLIKIKPYIHMEYIPVHSQQEYCDKLMELSGANDKDAKVPDYLEATIYTKNDAVIMVGNFEDADTAEKQSKINNVTAWYKPWFYKHTEKFLAKPGDEYIPIQDYLLRHNRAIFWVVESMIPFGNHPIFRLFLGWLCPPKPAFLKFTTTQAIREMTFAKQVFQDIVLPLNKLKEQVDVAIDLFDTFPLLVYPCRIYDHNRGAQGQLRGPAKSLLVPNTNFAMFNDLGVYGTPGPVKRREPYNPTYAMREMEKFTRDVGGYSFLYADIFMTEDEFEQMFDLTLYNEMRKKYKANGAFPKLYDKVKPELDVISIGNQYAELNSR